MATGRVKNRFKTTTSPFSGILASGNVNSTGTTIDSNHSLFLHTSDMSGISLVFFILFGTESYSLLITSNHITLLDRNKWGLVMGLTRNKGSKRSFGDNRKGKCYCVILDYEICNCKSVNWNCVCI